MYPTQPLNMFITNTTTVEMNFSVAIMTFCETIFSFANHFKEGITSSNIGDVERLLFVINRNGERILRNISHILNEKMIMYSQQDIKLVSQVITITNILCSMLAIISVMILIPQAINVYNTIFTYSSMFYNIEEQYISKKQADCMDLIETIDNSFEAITKKVKTSKSSLSPQNKCKAENNSSFENEPLQEIAHKIRKREIATLKESSGNMKRNIVLKLLAVIPVILAITIWRYIFFQNFTDKSQASVEIFKVVNVRRPYLTSSMYFALEQSSLDQDIVYGGSNLGNLYIGLACNNEEEFIRYKPIIQLHYPNFYSILNTLDSSSACTLLPALFNECVATNNYFMSYGLFRIYSFLIAFSQLMVKDYNEYKTLSLPAIGLISNSDWLKMSEIKVCYLNSLLQSNVVNFTSMFGSYIKEFSRMSLLIAFVNLLMSLVIFFVYFQILISKLVQLLQKSRKIVLLYPSTQLIKNKELCDYITKKIK